MYEKFYGFREKPFQIVPNPAYLYKSPKHEAALTYLEYGVAENVGFILLTGEIGSGKTTLVQYILGRLDTATEAAVIFNTNVSAEELLGLILEEFDVPRAAKDKAALLNALNQYLIDRYAQRKRVILIIDEAQNLSEKALEEVRMLSNLQSEDQCLLQIMLVGQPELVAKLKQPSLRQFTQRIAASYHLVYGRRRGSDPPALGRHSPIHQPAVPGRSGIWLCRGRQQRQPGPHPPDPGRQHRDRPGRRAGRNRRDSFTGGRRCGGGRHSAPASGDG